MATKKQIRSVSRRLDKYVADAIVWLERQPGVTTVVRGDRTAAPWSGRPAGWLRALKGDERSVHVYAYYHKGLQNLFVHAAPGPDRDRWVKQIQHGADLAALKVADAAARKAPVPDARKAEERVLTANAGTVVEVTPDLALSWLEKNTRNRSLRQSRVDRYADDMRNGRWMISPDAIAFDTNGVVINGQHRLWAVIESGCTVPMLVVKDLQPDVVAVLDDHLRRTLTDVVRIRRPGEQVTSFHTAIASKLQETIALRTSGEVQRAMARVSRQQQMEVLDRHWEAIEFALREARIGRGVRGLASANVMTPIARAYYTEDKGMLCRFAQVLKTGVMEEAGDKAAVLLRRILVEGDGKGHRPLRLAVYRKTERALRAFLDREPIKTLFEANQELFLLPEEQASTTRATRAKATLAARSEG